jgi:hypothetical protein
MRHYGWADRAGRLLPTQDEPGRSTGPMRGTRGLGGGEAASVGSLDRLAVETPNKGPVLSSKIVFLQQDKA